MSGRVSDLTLEDNVFVDELYKEKLGVTKLGEVFEIRGRRARVAGFTRGIRAFTTSPYVFTSFRMPRTTVLSLRIKRSPFL